MSSRFTELLLLLFPGPLGGRGEVEGGVGGGGEGEDCGEGEGVKGGEGGVADAEIEKRAAHVDETQP